MPDEPPATPDPAAERALIERACKGERYAVESLYEIHVDRIYRFVLFGVRGNHADAEDLTAEVFVRMVEYLPRFQWQNVPFQAWLYRIARNLVASHYRRPGNRGGASIDDIDFADPQAGPEGLAEHRLMLDDVYEAVKRLPEAQRRVIELRFGADLSVRETAQILSKSENNVKVLQHKALQRLTKLMRGGQR
ncbi:MAG: RNA polymerase sigma factor [Dehalococcoidia bacterium]